MKVAMFVFNDCRRDSRVLREARSLAAGGHDVRIFARRSDRLPDREERDGFRILRTVSYAPLPPQATLYYARRAPRRVAGLVRFSRACRRCLQDEAADVYHAHDVATLPGALRIRAVAAGKVLYDAHELHAEVAGLTRLERRIARIVEGYGIRRADAVITVGELIADELQALYGITRPAVVRNCCTAVRPQPGADELLRSAVGVPGDTPVILYLGGFSSGRGLRSLVRAAGRLDRGVVVLMGWGPLEPELRQLVAAERLEDRVLFHEPVEPDDVPRYASGATIGVVPIVDDSLNERYCNPNKLYECIAAGLPVVASDLPELRQIVERYGLGVTFEPSDPGSIAGAIGRVLASDSTYAAFRDGARRAARELSWEVESRRLLAVYERLGAA